MITRSEVSKMITKKVWDKEPMSRHTTFRIGGPCDLYVVVDTLSELKQLLMLATHRQVPVYIIGAGSNILVKDAGIRGIVLQLGGNFAKLDFDSENSCVTAGASCPLQFLLKKCADLGWGGLDFLAGIPGSVGGAVFMNAGGGKDSIGSVVKSVKIIDRDGETRNIEKPSLRFFYRGVYIKPGDIIISADIMLKKSVKNDIINNLKLYASKKSLLQPVGAYNAGCVFRNPPEDYAAGLIEKAGMKGLHIGGACISDLHANFINNDGTATAQDVLCLIEKIQATVLKKFSKHLQLEIKVWG